MKKSQVELDPLTNKQCRAPGIWGNGVPCVEENRAMPEQLKARGTDQVRGYLRGVRAECRPGLGVSFEDWEEDFGDCHSETGFWYGYRLVFWCERRE
jgi:hypothetical protein